MIRLPGYALPRPPIREVTQRRGLVARQAMGRPFVAPPDLSKERFAALRSAFMATMKDPQFLDEAKKMKLEINPVSGEKVQALVDETYKTSKPVAEKVANMLGRQGS